MVPTHGLHANLDQALNAVEQGIPTDLMIRVSNDSIVVEGMVMTPKETKITVTVPDAADEATMPEIKPVSDNDVNAVSSRGFRAGDKLLDVNGDRCEVIEVINGHPVVVFEGPGGGRKNILVGKVQDSYRKEGAPAPGDDDPARAWAIWLRDALDRIPKQPQSGHNPHFVSGDRRFVAQAQHFMRVQGFEKYWQLPRPTYTANAPTLEERGWNSVMPDPSDDSLDHGLVPPDTMIHMNVAGLAHALKMWRDEATRKGWKTMETETPDFEHDARYLIALALSDECNQFFKQEHFDGGITYRDGAPIGQVQPRGGFVFQLHSHVVLETSREAYEQQVAWDRDAEKRAKEREASGLDSVGVILAYSGPVEQGEIIGRAEFTNRQPEYLVRYRGGDGRQTEMWFAEDAVFQPAEFAEVDGTA